MAQKIKDLLATAKRSKKSSRSKRDFMNAVINANYDDLKDCLDAGIPATYINENREYTYSQSPIACLLANAGIETQSWDQTRDCISLLYRHGADLNYEDDKGYTPMDALDQGEINNPNDIWHAVQFVLTHGGKNRLLRGYVMQELEDWNIMTKKEFQEFEEEGTRYVKEKLPMEWIEQHPRASVKDFLAPLIGGNGDNVITSLVRAGSDVLEQAFPTDKWATMDGISKLKKIFTGLPQDEKGLVETMQKLDSKLRATYNLNKRRQARRGQSQTTLTKSTFQKKDGR